MIAIPAAWSTARLSVSDARLEDVPRLRDVFNSCGYVLPWDPSFYQVSADEVEALVRRSLAGEGADLRFRLQCFRPQGQPVIAGYCHLWHDRPEPDCAWVSIFVVHRDFHAQRYGREAAEGLLAILRAAGGRRVRLEVFLRNWPALRFWIGCGFTTIRAYDGAPVFADGAHASLVLERALG